MDNEAVCNISLHLRAFRGKWDSSTHASLVKHYLQNSHGFGDYIFQPRENVVYAALIRFNAMSVTSRKLRRKKAERQNNSLEKISLMFLVNGAMHNKPTTKSPSKTTHIDI